MKKKEVRKNFNLILQTSQTNHVLYDDTTLILQDQSVERMQNGHITGTLTSKIEIHC